MADTTGNFQDLLQFSGDTLYDLGEEFMVGNSLASTITHGFSNSAGVLALVAAQTANVTVSLPNGGTLLTNINISAGTTSNNLSAVTFSNSNGISFGLNGSTMTGSHAINVSAGTTSNNLSAITFSNSNNVSFGLNGSTMTGSANIKVSAGTTSNLLSAITFSNSNGVSFGLNGSVITASAVGGGGGSLNVSAGTTSNNLTAITFANSNGVSFGLNASVITASVPLNGLTGNVIAFDPSQPTGGNHVQTWAEVMTFIALLDTPAVIYPIGSCSVPVGTYNMLGATISGFFSFSTGTYELNLADGAVLENVSQIIETATITAASNTQPSLTWDGNVASGFFSFTMDSSGALVNNGTNPMIEVAGSATCTLLFLNGSVLNAVSGPIFDLGNVSVLYIKSNGILGNTVSLNWASGVASASIEVVHEGSFPSPMPTNGGYLGVIVNNLVQGQGGPTADRPQGIPIPLNRGTPYYDTDLDQYVVWDGGAWQAIGPGAATGGIAAAAGTQTATSGTVVFSNSNNVTFGMSNSSIVTASAAIKVSAGTTSNNLSAVTFSNSNGLSFGLNASTVTGIYGGFSNWQNGAPITSFASSRAFVSFQPIIIPYAITVTNILFLASLSQGTSSSASSGGYNISFGIYTLSGGTSGTFNSASTASSFVSWTSGNAYSSVSAIGYRPFSVASWAFTPGPYIFAVAVNSTILSSIALSFWGTASLVSIATGQGTLLSTMPWAPAVSASSVAALPASYGVSNTASVLRTGASVFNQPWISFMGT